MIVLPIPSLLSPSVLAELRLADLITSEECRRLNNAGNDCTRMFYLFCAKELSISDVVRVQCVKSLEVVTETADVLRRHGFETESNLLAGRQSSPSSICLCYVLQWSLLMTDTL